ncbi:hypothetical protein Taro_044014 [Colocasia esculenta]|uniref:Uncharacterized protein n=1 Tax=Colocasia esculenta TaxID=4460 RepID=A0A843WHZ1_COLES|nr:hypothetical protein [Colocasia esculenta]
MGTGEGSYGSVAGKNQQGSSARAELGGPRGIGRVALSSKRRSRPAKNHRDSSVVGHSDDQAQYDEIAAHEETKNNFSRLVAEERGKAIEEYRNSDELQDEIADLFQGGYDDCLAKVRGLYPDHDLSGAILAGDGEGGDQVAGGRGEELAAVVDEALETAIDRSLA